MEKPLSFSSILFLSLSLSLSLTLLSLSLSRSLTLPLSPFLSLSLPLPLSLSLALSLSLSYPLPNRPSNPLLSVKMGNTMIKHLSIPSCPLVQMITKFSGSILPPRICLLIQFVPCIFSLYHTPAMPLFMDHDR